MRGGEIEVTGDAGDWGGAEMSGGLIRVGGNTGGQVGAAYRGSRGGMTGGTILIDGSTGLEIGMRMKRGTIVVKGLARDFAGLEMKGGTLILGSADQRAGAWMKRGTIVLLTPTPLLPTFAYACSYIPTFVRVLAKRLGAYGVDVPCDETDGAYRLYSGDAAVSHKGEILVWEPRGG